MKIEIRSLRPEEQADAIQLSLDTFMECGKADYDERGLDVFRSFIYDKERIGELSFIGAFDGGKLIGTLAFRNRDNHLSLFFIRREYHRKGIGQSLFNTAIANGDFREITVNASTYAVPFYESLGFRKLSEAQNYKGLVSVPMKRCRNADER